MIDSAAEHALASVQDIEKVLRQVVEHPDVSAVEVGQALAPLQMWAEALKELKRASKGINLPDVEATEKWLVELEKRSPDENFSSLHRILDQQRQLAGLQNLELQAIQESLQGTGVSFDIHPPLRIAEWARAKGYKVWSLKQNPHYSHPLLEPGSGDIRPSHTELTLYKPFYRTREIINNRSEGPFWKKRNVSERTTVQDRSTLRICNLFLKPRPWEMAIYGRSTLSIALPLAQNLREFSGREIFAYLYSENVEY